MKTHDFCMATILTIYTYKLFLTNLKIKYCETGLLIIVYCIVWHTTDTPINFVATYVLCKYIQSDIALNLTKVRKYKVGLCFISCFKLTLGPLKLWRVSYTFVSIVVTENYTKCRKLFCLLISEPLDSPIAKSLLYKSLFP